MNGMLPRAEPVNCKIASCKLYVVSCKKYVVSCKLQVVTDPVTTVETLSDRESRA